MNYNTLWMSLDDQLLSQVKHKLIYTLYDKLRGELWGNLRHEVEDRIYAYLIEEFQ